MQLAPLTEARVWRLGLAYYFVFGGFVALALWLPKYYMQEYGLPLKTAAFITMLFTLPSGLIRALGGWVSDRWGGATVTWWVFWVSIVCLFFLSYPPTTLIIHGIKGDVSVRVSVGVAMFTLLVFVVGLAQGIGKASVYRSLADYYPGNMGSVGGLVGVIGGLGGFTLPIMFGIAADATNVRSSTFMLMYAVLGGVMIWTWAAARNERQAILEKDVKLRDQLVQEHLLEARVAGGRWLLNWRPDDPAFWRASGRRIALRNLAFSMPALFLSFAVWMVWSVVVVELPKIGFGFTTSELFWLAALPGLSGAALRLAYSFVVPIFGGRNFTVFSTATLLLPALWMALAVQEPATSYAVFVAIALLCGLGGRQLLREHGEHQLLLPQADAGHGARLERRRRQPRRRRHAGGGAGQHLRRRTGVHGGRSAELRRSRGRARSGCRTPATSGCRSSCWRRSRRGSGWTTSAAPRPPSASRPSSSGASTPGSSAGSTAARSAPSSASRPRFRRCWRRSSPPRDCSSTPSPARCSAPRSGRWVVGWPIASAVAG